ncbi:AMP-binding protein [Streptomyces sp. NBC_01408]|uniref:AMP-binding protein n=1 Tax=Streptomyces sp. NBC_01408 TaxID=2903855 RepID=UPI00224E1C9C|nr:AMP-binding protein [Streptomyces sp. NBC_01408]MCX4694211.1 AMP-binding protein [Streptomyces sp. NBC_01408]
MLEAPGTPEVLGLPEALGTPEVLGPAEAPGTPEVFPEAPGTPEVLGLPEAPGTPKTPDAPETPEVPGTPGTPEAPEVARYAARPWLGRLSEAQRAPVAPPRSVLHAFREAVARAPGRTALAYFDGRISYAEAEALSDSVAGHLAAHGIRRGDRVAVMLQNTPQFVLAVLAAWKAGAVVVPLNPMYKTAEAAHVLRDSGAAALVCEGRAWTAYLREAAHGSAVRTVLTASELDFQTRNDPRLLALAAVGSPAAVPAPAPAAVPVPSAPGPLVPQALPAPAPAPARTVGHTTHAPDPAAAPPRPAAAYAPAPAAVPAPSAPAAPDLTAPARSAPAPAAVPVPSAPGPLVPHALPAPDPAWARTVGHAMPASDPAAAHARPAAAAPAAARPAAAPAPVVADLSAVARRGEPAPDDPRLTGADTALISYTSGTSGTPKGAMNPHGALTYNAARQVAGHPLAEGAGYFALAPLFHITGMVCELAACFVNAGTLVLAHRFDAGLVLDAFLEHRPSYAIGPATAFMALAAHPGATRDHFASFQVLSSGGAPLPPALVERLRAAFGFYLRNGYGLTECTAPCASVPAHLEAPVDPASGTLSVGVPGAETVVRILDARGAEVPFGETGEIAVRGPQVVPGYWNLPVETAKAFPDGELRTGDVGFMDADGWLYVVDRKKDMINASGFKVWPREVEDVLYTHPAVREAAVVGVPDPYRGESVKAYVSLRPGTSAGPAELSAYCAARLAAYKYPRQVEVLPVLPKTTSGKILRRELRDRG